VFLGSLKLKYGSDNSPPLIFFIFILTIEAWHGKAGRGMARHGKAWQGKDFFN